MILSHPGIQFHALNIFAQKLLLVFLDPANVLVLVLKTSNVSFLTWKAGKLLFAQGATTVV